MAYYKGHLSPYLDCSSPSYIGVTTDNEKANWQLLLYWRWILRALGIQKRHAG